MYIDKLKDVQSDPRSVKCPGKSHQIQKELSS